MAPRSRIQVARLDYAEQAELHRIREELEPLAAMSRRAARGDGEAVPSLSYGIHSNGEIEDLPPSPTTICRQANSCYTS